MKLAAIYAHLSCSYLAVSTKWFATLFGRDPDLKPMPGLAERRHDLAAGFQLYQDGSKAGHGTLTLIVQAIREEHARLTSQGLQPGDVEAADYTTIARLRDPDGNLVVLAQPGTA